MTRRAFVIPYDSGHEGLRMGAGPSRLRALFDDVEEIHARRDWRAEIRTSFELYAELARRIRASNDAMPVVLSGNCGAASGTVAALGSDRLGIVWLDAHGDLMTPETTESGFLDGMALSVVTGQCFRTLSRTLIGLDPIPPERAIHIGGRDWSRGEIESGRAAGVTIVREPGEADAAIDRLAQSCDRVVFHVDLDVLDPSFGAANQFASKGGLAPDDVVAIIKRVQSRMRIAGFGFASYDPACDGASRIVDAAREILAALQE